MPLASGYSMDVVHRNAREMIRAGHPKEQAWAAAYENARECCRKRGKKLPKWLQPKGQKD